MQRLTSWSLSLILLFSLANAYAADEAVVIEMSAFKFIPEDLTIKRGTTVRWVNKEKRQEAAQAGCWGTCHHDANGMPDAPAGKNVTKYIAESRTEISTSEPMGGWDKRKADGDIAAELKAGHFMDLLRYKAGSGKSEDGYLLADRVMEGGQGVEFVGEKQGGNWVVSMKRKLSSSAAGDHSLALDQMYNIGFAIHDDHTNGRYHHVSLGYKLGFDNPEAEINATKQ